MIHILISYIATQWAIAKELILKFHHWAIHLLAILIGVLKGILLFHMGSAQDEDFGKGLGVFVLVSSPATSPAKDLSNLF